MEQQDDNRPDQGGAQPSSPGPPDPSQTSEAGTQGDIRGQAPENHSAADSAAASPPEQETPSWYYASGTDSQQGPVTFSALRQFASSGELSRDDLVWSAGLAGWTPGGEVEGLFAAPPVPDSLAESPPDEAPASPAGTPGPAAPEPTSWAPSPVAPSSQPPPAKRARSLEDLQSWFSSPLTWHVFAGVCGGIAVLGFLGSLLGWSKGQTWFAGSAVFLVGAAVGMGFGALLRAVQRLEASVSEARAARQDLDTRGPDA